MAATLTEEQKNQCAKILGVTPLDISDQITYMGELLTSQVATDIAAEITRWVTNSKGSKFVRMSPVTTNRGIDYDPEDEKADIRKNLALLFHAPDWANMSGGVQGYLSRG